LEDAVIPHVDFRLVVLQGDPDDADLALSADGALRIGEIDVKSVKHLVEVAEKQRA